MKFMILSSSYFVSQFGFSKINFSAILLVTVLVKFEYIDLFISFQVTFRGKKAVYISVDRWKGNCEKQYYRSSFDTCKYLYLLSLKNYN